MALDNLTPDKYQQIIINMSADRTAIVKGIAGSGKSLTLLKKAKQVSTFTSSYAIIVYTKSLKQFFVDELAEIGQTKGHVYYFEEWQSSPKPNFKYMFIDECQDFNSDEINDFCQHGTYCWFFGDSFQSIMEFPKHSVQSVEDTAKQLGVHPQNLCINWRLTIENAKVGEHIRPESRLSFACIKHGPKPRLVKSNVQLDKIIEYISNGNLTDVGILVYYNDQVRQIRDYFQSRGIPVQWKAKDDMEIDFKSTSPKIITWHCAKGLQFNDVFIPCCGLDEYKQYVQWSHEPMTEKKSALLTDVGILVYYNDQVRQIRDYFQSRGIPVQWKAKDDMEIDFKSTSPKIITWHCAKGLQFNDVFIPCCGLDEYKQYVQWSHEPMTEKKSALYVATTRPLENLYLLYTNNLAPLLPNPNSPVYSGNAGTNSGPF